MFTVVEAARESASERAGRIPALSGDTEAGGDITETTTRGPQKATTGTTGQHAGI